MRFPWNKENIKKISYPDGSSYVEVESFPPQIDHAITPIKSWINKKLKEEYDRNMSSERKKYRNTKYK